jgi:NADH-quinone oxidoreductase subunit C
MEVAGFLQAIQSLDPAAAVREKADRPAVVVGAAALESVMRLLSSDPSLAFDMLCAHTAIDWLAQGRIELVYLLESTTQGHLLQVSVMVDRAGAVVPTLSGIWKIAEFHEREVYDMFGVRYAGHPDLRRLLMEDDWNGFPLLKDYKDDFMLERPWG